MQPLLKNATAAQDRTLLFDAFDKSGLPIDATGMTLRIFGTTVAPQDTTGTITREDGGAAHSIVLSQAESNLFAVGERGMLVIPDDTNVQELSFPFFVTEASVAVAPPSVGQIQSGLATSSAVTSVASAVAALPNVASIQSGLATASALASVASAVSAIGTTVTAISTAVASVATAVAGIPAAVTAAVFARLIEPGLNFLQAMRALLAMTVGKTINGGTDEEQYRSARNDGTAGKVRVTMEFVEADRTAVTLDVTDET